MNTEQRQRQHDAITRFLAQFSVTDWNDAQANMLPVADQWNSLSRDGSMTGFVRDHMFLSDIDAAMCEVCSGAGLISSPTGSGFRRRSVSFMGISYERNIYRMIQFGIGAGKSDGWELLDKTAKLAERRSPGTAE